MLPSSKVRAGLVLGLGLVGLWAPSLALAHGGRPQTYDVLFGADAEDMVVPATLGVMSTTDGGAHWDWLCIEAMPSRTCACTRDQMAGDSRPDRAAGMTLRPALRRANGARLDAGRSLTPTPLRL